MNWIQALPAVAVAIVLLLVPGAIATAPVRMGLAARIAVSGVGSAASIGVAGVAFGGAGLAWAPWQPFIPGLIVGVAVWAVVRHRAGRNFVLATSGWRWIALSILGAAAVIGVVAFLAVPSPERVSQTYDNVFHMSAIAAILDGGDASSLTLRTLIETTRSTAFYPAAWHALAASVSQVAGVPATVAVNASWLAVSAVVWVPGAAWLAQVVLRRFAAGPVVLVAIPLATAFGAMPYALLSWGSLYPTFFATALLPAALAIPIVAGREMGSTIATDRWRVATLGALGIVAAVAAIVFTQPRVLASGVVLITPLAVAVTVRTLRAAWRGGGRSRRGAGWSMVLGGLALVLAAAAAFVYLVTALGLFTRPIDERLGGPQAAATQTVLTGLLQVVAQAWPTGVGAITSWPALLLAIAVAVGIIVAARTRGLRWVVVSYVIIAILFALAAGSDDLFSKLVTALWYKDRYRLSAGVPVLGVTLAALGVLATSRWVTRARQRSEEMAARLAVSSAWLVAVTSAVILGVTGASASIGQVFRLPDAHAVSEVVSQAQIDFMALLPDTVPADQRVLGDPWDGSGWTQLFGDREPVFPHVNGQWDPARLQLAYNLPQIATDPAVCAALNELRVRYVLYSPHIFGGGDPSGNHFPGPHAAVDAGLFAPVMTNGDSTLYRIDQCGPLN